MAALAEHTKVVERFRAFYDTFDASWLPRLEELYAPDFVVEDPFHVFRGDFVKMREYFKRVLAIPYSVFVTEDDATGKDGVYVRWRWTYRLFKWSKEKTIPGVTHLRFRDDKIVYHRDLFDAAMVFEGVPVVGTAIRTSKRFI